MLIWISNEVFNAPQATDKQSLDKTLQPRKLVTNVSTLVQ